MLTQEKINLNYVSFVGKLKKYGCYTQAMEDDTNFNELLKNGSAFVKDDTGGAYEGSLVENINRVAFVAYYLNDLLFPEVRVPVDSLIRVCYLQQISKALIITKNDVEWEIKKGKLFKFTDNNPAMKCGEYSLFLCAKYGIQLNEEEYEAILSVDKPNDDQIKYFSNMLGQILRASVELTNTERRIKYKQYLSNKKEE